MCMMDNGTSGRTPKVSPLARLRSKAKERGYCAIQTPMRDSGDDVAAQIYTQSAHGASNNNINKICALMMPWNRGRVLRMHFVHTGVSYTGYLFI
jgi:hypothetical protein